MMTMLSGGLYLSDRPADTAVSDAPQILDSRLVIQDTTVIKHDTTREAIRSLPALNPYARQHEGFLGFIRLEPKHATPDPVLIPLPIYADESIVDDTFDQHIVSYSLSEGSDTGIFLPEEFLVSAFEGLSDTTNLKLMNCPAQRISGDLPKVPPVAEMNRKEGYVEILMLVDQEGRPGFFSCRDGSEADPNALIFQLEVVLKNNTQATLQFSLINRITPCGMSQYRKLRKIIISLIIYSRCFLSGSLNRQYVTESP